MKSFFKKIIMFILTKSMRLKFLNESFSRKLSIFSPKKFLSKLEHYSNYTTSKQYVCRLKRFHARKGYRLSSVPIILFNQ